MANNKSQNAGSKIKLDLWPFDKVTEGVKLNMSDKMIEA